MEPMNEMKEKRKMITMKMEKKNNREGKMSTVLE